jgi:two-component system response regulator YesN
MEERYAEDLSLDAVAAELGVSPSHLSRLLGRQAGLGFADCLGRLRVERAKAFLASGRNSIKEASVMVGFRDPAYFARVFRRFCGMSPAEYRSGRGAGGGEAENGS